MSEKIKVAIKIRPLIEREKSEGAQDQWTLAKNSIYLTNSKTRDKDCYYFDYIFGQEKTNADLFEAITKPIIDASVRGFNGTIFAYGQTSSGKTYTMMGTDLEPGIIPQTINYMFQAIHSITSLEGRNFLLRASYMEIYNEKIIDLLGGKEGLKLREADGQVVIAKLKEEVACTAEKILNLMKRGEKIRKTGQTNMNERSSRSHTIFRLIIESGIQDEEENGAVQVSHLNLVDLAGSERVDQSGAIGERLKEGCSINTSLFMLGRVISQLSEGQEQYVSFRDSKLTRILQSSLGGNAHTAIICTVTPAVIDETISTLGFASRAAHIQNKPLKNEVLTDAALLKRYARQIAKLQEELKVFLEWKSVVKYEVRLFHVEIQKAGGGPSTAKTLTALESELLAEIWEVVVLGVEEIPEGFMKTKHSNKSNEEIESKLEETKMHNRLLQQRIDLLQEKLIGSTLLDSDTLDKKKTLRRRTWGGQTTKPRFSVYLPQILNPIEEEYEYMDQESPKVFSTSVADFQSSGFETPLEEFELELIEAERNRFSTESTSSEDTLVTISSKCRTVSFADQIENKDVKCQTIAAGSEEGRFSSESDCSCVAEFNKCKAEQTTSRGVDCQTDNPYSDVVEVAVNTTLELTSDACLKQCKKCETRVIPKADMKDANCQTEAAVCVRLSDQFIVDTPPKELRERIKYYQKEYDELREFTTLEKQLICEEQATVLLQENEQLRRENNDIKKSVAELETMYLEANRSLSLVQDENKHLKQKLEKEIKHCSELSKSISLLNNTQEKTNRQLKDILALEKEMKALKQKLHTLENEKLDFEMVQQLQEEKYNKRITELSKSLEEAWKNNEIVNKDEMDRSNCEGCRCLANELEALKVELIAKVNVITSQEDKNEPSIQGIYGAQKQESEYDNLLAKKEQALDVLCKKLSEAENKILELSSTVECHANCTAVLRERDVVLSLQEQVTNEEKFADCSKESEQTLRLMQEELSKAKNEIMELAEVRDRHAACIAALKEKEECCFASQKELEGRYSELKEKEEIIMLLQERLREVENNLEEVRKLTEDYSTCVEELKENQETVFILQAQLSNNEIVLKDMKERILTLTDDLNKREQKIADLEGRLVKTESEIQNIHIPYVELLREKDESLSSLMQQLAKTEKHLEEREAKCLKLAENLKENEESTALLQRDLIQAQNQINQAAKIKKLHEECERVVTENQQTVTLLHEQLTNSKKSILDVKQKYSEAIDALKKSQDSCTLLQEKLNNAENELKALFELKAKHVALMEQFRQKEDVHVSLKEQLTNHQISLYELEQNNVLLTHSLKDKDDVLILLQNKLSMAEHSTKEAAEIKESHAMCTTALNEKEESLLSYKQKIAVNEVFIAETTENLFKLSQACAEKEERIASLEKKLYEAEENLRKTIEVNCNDIQKEDNEILLSLEANNDLYQETEANETNLKCASVVEQNELAKIVQNSTDLILVLKEKEEIIAKLQQKLQDAESCTEDLAELKEIHSLCAETLKKKEELLTLLQSKYSTLETSLEEMTEKCSNLSRSLRENEQNTEPLQKKLLDCEIELEENHSVFVEMLNENKLESATVMEKKFCVDEWNEKEIMVMGKKLSAVLKEKDEYLSFLQENLDADETLPTKIMQKCLALTEALKEKEETIALLHVKLHEFSLEVEEGKEFKQIHSGCVPRLKKKNDLVLYLEEKLVANELSAVGTTQNCLELAKTFGDLGERMDDLEQQLCEEENNKETTKTLSTYMQVLEEKGETFLTLNENLIENKALLIDLTQKCSNLTETLKEKEETIALLQEKLYEPRSEVEEKEIHSQCMQRLREKDALLLYLQEKLAANELSAVGTTQNCLELVKMFGDLEERMDDLEQQLCEEENNKETTKTLSSCMQALEEKNETCLALNENLIENKALLIDLTQKCSNLTESLKEKEETIALLQEKLYDSRSEVEEKEIHSQCMQRLREKDALLLFLQEKLAANELSAVETTQNCLELAKTFGDLGERMDDLEQQLCEEENNKETTKTLSTYMQVLEEKGETFLTLNENLIENKALLIDLTQKCSNLTETLKEKEETIALLREKLYESQSEVEEKEIHSQCMQRLREKDALLLYLQEKLAANELSAVETTQNCSKLGEVFRGIEERIDDLEQKLYEEENNKETAKSLSTCIQALEEKDKSLLTLQENLVTNETLLVDLTQKCPNLKEILKSKERIIALLEEKLHYSQSELQEEKEIHLQCIQRLREKDELLSHLERKIIANEISSAETIQNCSKLVVALRGIEESVNALEQKLYEAENCEREMERKVSMYVHTVKKKGEIIALLEEKLLDSQSKVEGEEIHSQCIQRLREKDELLSNLERKITANEISAAETIENCSKLTGELRGIEESISVLEQKLYEAENCKGEMERRLLTYVDDLKEKENTVVLLQMKLHESESKVKEVNSICMDSIKQKEDSFVILQEKLAAVEATAAEMEKSCLTLSTALEEKEKTVSLLQEKLHEAEGSKKEMKCVEVFEENRASKEIFTPEMVKNCSGLANILKQIEDTLGLLAQKMCEIGDDKGTEMHSFVIALKQAENTIVLMQKRMEDVQEMEKIILFTEVFKEREQIVLSPQEELCEARNKMGGDTELNEICSACTAILKQKEALLVHVQESHTNAEISVEELTKKCSKLHKAANLLKERCEICSEVLKVIPEVLSAVWQHLPEKTEKHVGEESKTNNSMHVEISEKTEVLEDLLKEKLSKAEVELAKMKKVTEEHSECATLLKLKEETVICLKYNLASNQRSLASMEEKYSLLTDVLSNKDLEMEVLKEKFDSMINEVAMCAELKEVHATCINILKEKEELVSSLQEELINSSKYLAKVEEKLVEITREKEESLKFLQEMKNETEKKVMEIQRLNEVNEINTEALKQKTEDILSLKEKLSSNEIFIRDLEAAHINITNVLKNKEASLILLEQEMLKAKEEIVEAANLKKIHLTCTEVEKERELTELLKKEIIDLEMHIKEMEVKHAILTSNLKEKEEIIASQQEKLRVAENETLQEKLICTTCSDRKENGLSVQEQQLACQEAAETESQEKTVQEALKKKKEDLQIDSVSVTNLEQNVMPLINTSRDDKSTFNMQQGGPGKAENDRLQMIIKVSDASIKGQETVLPLVDQLFNEELLSTEIEESCLALMNNLEESALTINLFKEKIDNFTKEMESTQLNIICIECAKIKETDKILGTLKQKITCCEKEISEYKIKLTVLVKHLSYIAKLLNEKENCLKAAERRLHIAENKLALLSAELTTPISERGSSLEVTPPFQSHISPENDVTPMSDILEWDTMTKEREILQYERDNYQRLYEGERLRLQELANLYQEELDEIQMSSFNASQSLTHNYSANAASQVQQRFVSEKMLKEIENRKSNNFDSEIMSNDPFSKGSSCNKTELEILRNEATALMKTSKELEDTVKEYETSLKQLRCENVNLTSELQNKTQEIYSLRKTVVKEISSLNPNLKPALKEHCLQKLLSTLLSSVMEKQKEIHEKMEDQISYLNNKIVEKEKQHIDSDKRKDSWIKQLESEVEQLTKQLDVLDSRKVPVKQDSSDILAKLKEENQELIEKIRYLEQDLKSFQLQMSAEAETETLKHKDFISKIDRLESNILCKEKIIMKLEEEIETKNCKEHQLLVKFENAIKRSNTLECNLKAMEGKLNDLEQMKLTLLQELECKFNDEREQKDILNSECERNKLLTAQIMQLKTHMENTSRKNELLTEQKAKLERNLEEEQQKNSTLLLKMEAMEQEMGCFKQEAISKDVAFKQEKLALQEEQQKTCTLSLKIKVMEEEMGHLQQIAISKDITFQQEKQKFEKKILELEYNAEICTAETVENRKQMDKIIKQLEQEIEIKRRTSENELKKVSELQLNLKVLEEKVSDLDSTNSALAEEVKCKHEMEQNLIHKLNIEMQKVQTLANHLAQVTAQKEDIVQRNEDLIKRNVKLELQYDLLQKRKMQVQSLLDIVEKEFKPLKEEVIARKATMVKVYTVGQPYETRKQAQGQKSIDLLTCEQQEFIFRFKEGIREIKEYLSQTDTYWEELENIRHENNVLYKEHGVCKAALEAEKSKTAQLEKETSKECASSSEEKQASEASKETASRLERTVHQLCKIEKEREQYKKCLKHEQEERRVMTHDLQQLKSKLESSKSKNNVLYTHARDLQVRLEELRDRNEHLELENNGAAHRIAQLQEEIKDLREAKAAAAEKCQCTTLGKEVIQLRNEASEKAAWEQRCKAERRQCQKFEKDIKLYKEKISELKAELYKIHDSEQKIRKAKLANVGIQVDEIKLWKGTSETPYDVVRENKELEAKIDKYKELCRYRMQKIRNLEQKVQQLEDSSSRPQGPSEMQSIDKMENKENQEDVAFNRPLSENVITYSLHSTPQKK